MDNQTVSYLLSPWVLLRAGALLTAGGLFTLLIANLIVSLFLVKKTEEES